MTSFVTLVYTTCQAYQYRKANQHAGPGDTSREEGWGSLAVTVRVDRRQLMAAVTTMV